MASPRALREKTLYFKLELAQMPQANPVRHRAKRSAAIVRTAPGADRYAEREFRLAARHIKSDGITLAVFMRHPEELCNQEIPGRDRRES